MNILVHNNISPTVICPGKSPTKQASSCADIHIMGTHSKYEKKQLKSYQKGIFTQDLSVFEQKMI